MNKLKTERLIITEGKYDVCTLNNVIDGVVITTNGFGIYHDEEKKAFIRRYASESGVLLITDSDRAGFQIRNYLTDLAGEANCLQCYIPQIPGKERRKSAPGKEGLLGVEGMEQALLYQSIQKVLLSDTLCDVQNSPYETSITYTDLFDWGLSGSSGSKEHMQLFLRKAKLPSHLNKRQLLQILNRYWTREQAEKLAIEINSAFKQC